MIKFIQLCKKFNNHFVLDHVSGQIDRGKIVCLIGSSGAGKSTLLRCLNLLEMPDEGEIFLHNIAVLSTQADLRNIRRQVGMVFQQFHLFPHLTVLDNIQYGCKIKNKFSLKQAQKNARTPYQERCQTLLTQLNLADKQHVYPAHLSGGQKQRVAIARALALDPQAILFDEPVSALDPETVHEISDLIKQLSLNNKAVVIVTHDMNFARKVADEIWFLDQGKIIEQTASKIFFNQPQTKRAQEFIQYLSMK